MKKSYYGTNEKSNRYYHLFFMICMTLIIAFLFANLTYVKSEAATGLKIYNETSKKEINYKDKQIKVTLNGKKISKDQTPGILENGIALLSYEDIFMNSNIKADCEYDKDKGTITISKYGITIHMTLGSKKAKVNGKSVTLPVAPVKIKYINAKETKVLVPSRFVAETLGLGYQWYSSKNTVAITKNSLDLSYNDGERFEYKGTQGAVKINGTVVTPGKMPSIIRDNTALLRAKRVFSDSSIGANYQFDKKKGTITLSRDKTVIKMTIGSLVAYVNGEKYTLDTAPLVVHNYEAETSYVMVPGRFTANHLGFDYEWDGKTATSIITSVKKEEVKDGKDTVGETEETDKQNPSENKNGSGNTNPTKPNPSNPETAPELGDEGIIHDTGVIFYNFSSQEGSYSIPSKEKDLSGRDSAKNQMGYVYSFSKTQNGSMQNTESFSIYNTIPFGEITSGSDGRSIKINVSNATCIDYSYDMSAFSSKYVSFLHANNNTDLSSTLEFEIIPEKYDYDISLSEDGTTMTVNIYSNSLTSLDIGSNTDGEYIALTGIWPLQPEVSIQGDSTFVIDLPYTVNALGDLNTVVNNSILFSYISVSSLDYHTRIVLVMNEFSESYFYEMGNQYILSFHTPEVIEDEDEIIEGADKISDEYEEDETVIIDKSKYEIVIPKPNNIKKSQISHEDDYFNNRFYITLPGDHTKFYSEHNISWGSKVIKSIKVSLNKKKNTDIVITTTKLQGYVFTTDVDNIYVNIGNPRDIYKNIVVLDPGHGGPANGAQYFNTKEKDLNLKVLYTIGKKYFDSNPSELKVYYTRKTDVDMPLRDRAAFSEKVGADLFVSLHMNAHTNSSVKGTEVYYAKNNNSKNKAGLNSQMMAKFFLDNLLKTMGTKSRGVLDDRFTVIYRNTVPAVLVELGFMSNKEDFAKISDEKYQDKAAKTIYDTLLQIFEQYPTGRKGEN